MACSRGNSGDGINDNFVDANGDGIDDNWVDANGDGINDLRGTKAGTGNGRVSQTASRPATTAGNGTHAMSGNRNTQSNSGKSQGRGRR